MTFKMSSVTIAIFLVYALTQVSGFIANYPEDTYVVANPSHGHYTTRPSNRVDQLHKNIEDLHKQRADKSHQKIVKPIRSIARPPHPAVPSVVDINQPAAYYGPVGPMIPGYQYIEPVYHNRMHPLPGYSHFPVLTENRDYIF